MNKSQTNKSIQKFGASGRLISRITEVDTEINIETLYLSNNIISSLQGISKFKNLHTLSLANNKITSFDQVQQLISLNSLQNLRLACNPICYLPYYRLHIINLCSSIIILDDEEVTEYEREQAQSVIEKEEIMYNVMFGNDQLIRKLEQLILKVILHLDLRKLFAGKVAKLINRNELKYSPVNSHLLMKHSSSALEITRKEYSYESSKIRSNESMENKMAKWINEEELEQQQYEYQRIRYRKKQRKREELEY
ncbi:MAG: hypothetical protein EZS28_021720 [Streblomastix strix]|uniref:Uncharacterized protein n=1 Tax=Streblomastix strix TaxID=222440 RepID=A0A5J4VJG9_9EUKA|nr:MAG: hypothetical protein EZS28_021720 [Streblomastix strix]